MVARCWSFTGRELLRPEEQVAPGTAWRERGSSALHTEWEMPIGFQSAGFYLAIGYACLEFREEVQATETFGRNYWVSIVQVIVIFRVRIPWKG